MHRFPALNPLDARLRAAVVAVADVDYGAIEIEHREPEAMPRAFVLVKGAGLLPQAGLGQRAEGSASRDRHAAVADAAHHVRLALGGLERHAAVLVTPQPGVDPPE